MARASASGARGCTHYSSQSYTDRTDHINTDHHASRYDWLARLHGAAGAAALLGGPMHEFEAELRPWAAGQGWAAGRAAWRRRVLTLAQLPAEQQGHELLVSSLSRVSRQW